MKDNEAEVIYNRLKSKKKSGSDETGGQRDYMTVYYSKLLKQKIKQLNKMVEWRKDNIMALSSKNKRVKTETKGRALTF